MNMTFEGQGKYKWIYTGAVYEGQFVNDIKQDIAGTLIDADGNTYVGQWQGNQPEGIHIRTTLEGEQGQFKYNHNTEKWQQIVSGHG